MLKSIFEKYVTLKVANKLVFHAKIKFLIKMV